MCEGRTAIVVDLLLALIGVGVGCHHVGNTSDAVDGGSGGTDGDTDTNGGVVDCTGIDNFVLCTVDTSDLPNGDLSYDICVAGSCVSPGSCDDATCNVPGPHFAPPPADLSALGGGDYTRIEGAAEEWLTTDNTTGLVWQGCRAGRKGEYCGSGDSAAAETFTWAEALVHCDGLSWGGYDDWRLPDEYELQSIVHYGEYEPAINQVAFPATPRKFFWSSSSNEPSPAWAWPVSFDVGVMRREKKTEHYYVRCVRGAPTPSSSDRFKRTLGPGDDWLVADRATGLVWQGCPAGLEGGEEGCHVVSGTPTQMTWYEASGTADATSNPGGANDYCGDLEWGGHDDWYLPDVKQLYTIVNNRDGYWGAIDGYAFPGIQPWVFWTSSTFARNPASAWILDFGDANLNGLSKDSNSNWTPYTNCVREGD